MLIQSKIAVLGTFKSVWSTDTIKNEPMLFNCDRLASVELGGPITKNFIENLPIPVDIPIVVDSRVHMLMKGWYPCIPGFHHDDVPRSTESGQPNYVNPEYRSQHIMGLVNGDICPTQFVIGDIDLEIPENVVIYKKWHEDVKTAIDHNKLNTINAESGKFIHFDDRSFHQGVSAVANGWRWFIRVSYDTDRVKVCTNELRKHVQVYLAAPMEGW